LTKGVSFSSKSVLTDRISLCIAQFD